MSGAKVANSFDPSKFSPMSPPLSLQVPSNGHRSNRNVLRIFRRSRKVTSHRQRVGKRENELYPLQIGYRYYNIFLKPMGYCKRMYASIGCSGSFLMKKEDVRAWTSSLFKMTNSCLASVFGNHAPAHFLLWALPFASVNRSNYLGSAASKAIAEAGTQIEGMHCPGHCRKTGLKDAVKSVLQIHKHQESPVHLCASA